MGLDKLKLKVGDRARVVSNRSGHRFEIGSEIEMLREYDAESNDYYCENKNGEKWWLNPNEFEIIQNPAANYHQVVPNSHGWTDLNQLLECLKSGQADFDYIRVGIENTIKAGYNLKKI